MKMNDKILWDENKKVKFDFSNALHVFEPHELAHLYSEYLSDVDFVIEEQERLICLEYKNGTIRNANAPEAFRRKLVEETFWKKIAKKFYGTMFLVWACDRNQEEKPVHYVLLLESGSEMDEALKKRFLLKVKKQLPFQFNDRSEIRRKVIEKFSIVDLKEWREKYPQYPVYENEAAGM